MLTTLQQTLRSGRILTIIYLTSTVLGLLVAIPMYSTLTRLDGNSLAVNELLAGFDYTVFQDFMHEHGEAISPLLSVGRWTGVVYLFLSIWFTGGLLMMFARPSAPLSVNLFWQACLHYVRRYLRLFAVTLPFLLAAFLIPLLAGILVAVLAEEQFTERGLFWLVFGGFAVGFVLASLVLCVSDYAKVLLLKEDEQGSLRAFGKAGRLVLRHPLATLGRYWALIGIGTVLFGLYFLLDSLIGMDSWLTIILMLVVQQAFIFSRIVLKGWNLGIVYAVYEQYAGSRSEAVPVGKPD
ncbi:hypothetical protein [Arsenicibacter rosenii]|uniref:Beta-carotene 15,15'-monooxygenase n=1 Tax=Arsenicibacter rosenii TaxID=1750698 RepID=A0A1S2VN31_9BACT|nr:hypothetical protein [Arsenicibacter rosenii]OIN60181.1 hypothetical protein BLX24_04925 [Arsenicibacter rosenii]